MSRAGPTVVAWKTGDTALHLAATAARESVNMRERYSRLMLVMQVLLESRELCTDIPNVFGRTPLDIARGGQFTGGALPDAVAAIEARAQQGKCAR